MEPGVTAGPDSAAAVSQDGSGQAGPGQAGPGQAGPRQARRALRAALAAPDWRERLHGLDSLPDSQVLAALAGALCDRDESVRLRAVAGLGLRVAALAGRAPEKARLFMRRLLWSLNEESGAIGWGAAEALGEIMACHAGLAGEYHRLLVSYIVDEGEENNFLELPELRRGAYWGLARLAGVRPELLAADAIRLAAGLAEADPVIRGLACLALGRVAGSGPLPGDISGRVAALRNDSTPVRISREDAAVDTTVAALAAEALAAIGADR